MGRHTTITSLIALSVVVFYVLVFLHLRGIRLTAGSSVKASMETQAIDQLLCHADPSCTDHVMSGQLKNFLRTQWQCAGRPWVAHVAENSEDSTATAKRIVALALHYVELFGASQLRHEHHPDRHEVEIVIHHGTSRSVRLHYARQQDTLKLARIDGLCALLKRASGASRPRTEAETSDFVDNP